MICINYSINILIYLKIIISIDYLINIFNILKNNYINNIPGDYYYTWI